MLNDLLNDLLNDCGEFNDKINLINKMVAIIILSFLEINKYVLFYYNKDFLNFPKLYQY